MRVMVLESRVSGKVSGFLPAGMARCLFLLFMTCFAEAIHAAPALIATGNRLGQLGPCGCAVDPKGGIERLAQFAQSTDLSNSLWVDSGQNLFAFDVLNPELAVQWKGQANWMAKVYRQLGVQVALPTLRDFAAGDVFLEKWAASAGVQMVAANLTQTGKSSFWKPWVRIQKGGEDWAITGVVSTGKAPAGIQVQDALASLAVVLEQIPKQENLKVVVLSSLGLAMDRQIAGKFHPYAIVGSSDDILDAPEKIGSTWIVSHRREAQSAFLFETDSGKASELFLNETWDAKGALAKRFGKELALLRKGQRDAAIKSAARETLSESKKGKQVHAAKPSNHYVGNPYLCKSCHLPQHQFWEKTQHASAYLVLYSKNQHFDPECVSCHSLGFGEKRGFLSVADPLLLKGAPPRKGGEKPIVETILEETFAKEPERKALDARKEPERFAELKKRFHESMDSRAEKPGWEKVYAGIQCEHCHGNRQVHMAANTVQEKRASKKAISKSVCLSCHTSDRDPDFSFEKKLPKIACPKIAK